MGEYVAEWVNGGDRECRVLELITRHFGRCTDVPLEDIEQDVRRWALRAELKAKRNA